DPSDTDPKSGIERMYKAAKFISSSNTHPKAAQAGNWTAMESIWQAGPYNVGDRVFDDSNSGDGKIYECVIAGQSNTHPSERRPNPWHWNLGDRGACGTRSWRRLALLMADPAVITGWTTFWSGALAGKTTGSPAWPSGTPFRMTEFSPYS